MDKINEVTLEKIKHVVHTTFPCFQDIEVLTDVDFVQQNVCLVIRTSILGKSKTFKYKYPYDWWEAFKERFFPNWLEKYFPVCFHFINIDAQIVFRNIPHWVLKDWKPKFMTFDNHSFGQEDD